MEEWEEPLHPGSLGYFYPTAPHKATQFAHDPPPRSTDGPVSAPIPRACAVCGGWGAVGGAARFPQACVQTAHMHRAVHEAAGFRPVRALYDPRPHPVGGPVVPSLAPTRPRAGALLAVCAALAAVGCGQSSPRGSAGGDPASVVPASTPLYGEAVVKPDGDQKAKLDSLLRRILRTDDPGAKIEKAFDDATRKDGVTYANDVKPWLGKRVGAFLSGVTRGGKPQGAAVVATSDTGKALDALRKGEKVRSHKTYRGVGYDVFQSGSAAAAVGDFAVVGTEAALRQVIDTAKGGNALADKSQYGDARGEAGTDGLVSAYADPDGLLGLAASSGKVDPTVVSALRQAFAGAAGQALAASVSPEDAGFAVSAAATGVRKSGAASGDAAGAVAGVPGDAWLAIGIGDIGGKIGDALTQAGRIGGFAGAGIEAALGQLKAQSGIDVRQDLLSWMGDGALFVRGTSKGSVGGALVVRSKDPAKSSAVVPKLGAFLGKQNAAVRPLTGVAGVDSGIELRFNGSPEIYVASAGNRFVVAVGREALVSALRPAGRLGADATFRRAAGQLGQGMRPAFYLNLGSVLKLVDNSGAATGPDYAKAKPYLQAFTAIVAGAKRDGDVVHANAFVGVR
jgi:uncharacterized protein DUF3352